MQAPIVRILARNVWENKDATITKLPNPCFWFLQRWKLKKIEWRRKGGSKLGEEGESFVFFLWSREKTVPQQMKNATSPNFICLLHENTKTPFLVLERAVSELTDELPRILLSEILHCPTKLSFVDNLLRKRRQTQIDTVIFIGGWVFPQLYLILYRIILLNLCLLLVVPRLVNQLCRCFGLLQYGKSRKKETTWYSKPRNAPLFRWLTK